jgi:serine/threonine-protein kinase HipA
VSDRHLEAHLYGKRAGVVSQTSSGRLSFTYDQTYVSGPTPTPISLSMPAIATSYTARRVRPFLEGLLPEDDAVRRKWGQELGVNSRNAFALLERMGEDCAGAVTFVGDREARERPKTPRPTRLAEADIAARLREFRTTPGAWTIPGDRWSLAGAQSKFALARTRTGEWVQPSGDAASTHIIKPGIDAFRHHALNEHVCLAAARRLGISAAETEFVDFAGETAVVIARYDRRRDAKGRVVRIHQEDACQALSVYPHRKYEAQGGPTAKAIADLLWEHATRPREDVLRFAEAIVLNYLLGAPDAHAKNYSVLLAGGQVRLAPLYDVASGLPYDALGADQEIDRSAMGIGGKKLFGTVAGRHWDRFARECRLEADEVRALVTRLGQDLPDALEAAFVGAPTSDLRNRLVPRVARLCAGTIKLLNA